MSDLEDLSDERVMPDTGGKTLGELIEMDLASVKDDLGFIQGLRRYATNKKHFDRNDTPWIDGTMSSWVRGQKLWEKEAYVSRLKTALRPIARDEAIQYWKDKVNG